MLYEITIYQEVTYESKVRMTADTREEAEKDALKMFVSGDLKKTPIDEDVWQHSKVVKKPQISQNKPF